MARRGMTDSASVTFPGPLRGRTVSLAAAGVSGRVRGDAWVSMVRMPAPGERRRSRVRLTVSALDSPTPDPAVVSVVAGMFPGAVAGAATGAAAAAIGWLLVSGCALIAWFTVMALPVVSVLRFSTQFWLAAHGAGAAIGDRTITLIPLGLTAAQILVALSLASWVLRHHAGPADADGEGRARTLRTAATFVAGYALVVALAALASGSSARLPQVNGCAGSTVLVGGTSTVAGLADAAAAVTVTLQEVKAEGHTVLLARTGRFLDIVDLGNPDKALSSAALAKAVAPSLQRQCGVAAGTCPTTVKAESILGVTTGELGWLIENDLPRVTLGAGRWGATTSGPPNLVGSQCEAVDLNQVPKATQSLHRTYLLADDSAAPSGFGVDEAVYTFATATEATALVRKINANFESCRTRTRTATVTTLKPAGTTGADGAKVTVQEFTVVQRVSATKNVAFRVALAAVGTRVVYLLANPSGDFDFTDAQWTAVGTRAAQRATQF